MNEPVLDSTHVEDRILFIALELFKHHYNYNGDHDYSKYIKQAEKIAQIEMNYQFQPTQEN